MIMLSNPAKCAVLIKLVNLWLEKVVVWFQPHGYGPTRFLRKILEEILEYTNFRKMMKLDELKFLRRRKLL